MPRENETGAVIALCEEVTRRLGPGEAWELQDLAELLAARMNGNKLLALAVAAILELSRDANSTVDGDDASEVAAVVAGIEQQFRFEYPSDWKERLARTAIEALDRHRAEAEVPGFDRNAYRRKYKADWIRRRRAQQRAGSDE